MGAVDAAMTEPDEQDLTAHHEAGHAVAALACGGGLISITIGPTPEHPEYAGNTGVRVEKWWHLPFVVYAGPWAEARSQWTRYSLDSLDDEDDDAVRSVTTSAWRSTSTVTVTSTSTSSWRKGYFRTARGPSRRPPEWLKFSGRPRDEVIAERGQGWSRQLEELCWPVIRVVAGMLLDGCTDVDAITRAVRG